MGIALVIFLLLAAVLLFSWERIPPDVVAIGLLTVLLMFHILTPKEAFAAFGSDFVVMLACIFIISTALQHNGVMDWIAQRITFLGKMPPQMLLISLMLLAGAVSAFMNNTTVAAIFLAPTVSVCRQLKISSSKLLMPMAFASLLGGTCTLIGTSTNIAGSELMARSGLPPVAMFEFLPVGIILMLVGVLFMSTIGYRLLPAHTDKSVADEYNIRSYLSEIVVLPNSPLIGKRLQDTAKQLGNFNFNILKVIRHKEAIFPEAVFTLQKGDILLVECNRDELMRIRQQQGIDILGKTINDSDLMGDNLSLAEVVVTPQSPLVGSTIKSINLRNRYGLTALAMHHRNENVIEKIAHMPIRAGDVLLLQGQKDSIERLRSNVEFIVLEEIQTANFPTLRKGWLSLLFFGIAIVCGSLELLPLSGSFLMATLGILAIKAIDIKKIYQYIDWRLLVLIGSMSAFGAAMSNTGADSFLADGIMKILAPFGTLTILGGFMLLTMLLTQPMSNAAAALVVLPVAIQVAHTLGANERTFAIGIILAASVSMITPFEPACIIIFSPGKYRIIDFLKVGGLLTFILWIILMILVPYYWGL